MFYFFIMIMANKEFQTKKPLLTDKVRLFGIFQVNLMFLWHKQIANFFPQNVLMSSTHLHQVFDWCRCLVDEVVEATQAHYTRASLWNLRLYLPQMNWEECRVMVKNDTLYNTWVRKAIPINYFVNSQGSHFSGDTKFHVFSRLFPGKCDEIPGQFVFESVFVLKMQIWQRRKSDFFGNDILKSESWKT